LSKHRKSVLSSPDYARTLPLFIRLELRRHEKGACSAVFHRVFYAIAGSIPFPFKGHAIFHEIPHHSFPIHVPFPSTQAAASFTARSTVNGILGAGDPPLSTFPRRLPFPLGINHGHVSLREIDADTGGSSGPPRHRYPNCFHPESGSLKWTRPHPEKRKSLPLFPLTVPAWGEESLENARTGACVQLYGFPPLRSWGKHSLRKVLPSLKGRRRTACTSTRLFFSFLKKISLHDSGDFSVWFDSGSRTYV